MQSELSKADKKVKAQDSHGFLWFIRTLFRWVAPAVLLVVLVYVIDCERTAKASMTIDQATIEGRDYYQRGGDGWASFDYEGGMRYSLGSLYAAGGYSYKTGRITLEASTGKTYAFTVINGGKGIVALDSMALFYWEQSK